MRSVLGWMAALTALWVALALMRPSTTFHLAPALIPTVALFAGNGGELPAAILRRLVVAGGVVGIVTAFVLNVFGTLSGPSLLPVGGALLESIVTAMGGTLLGVALAGQLADGRRRPGQVNA